MKIYPAHFFANMSMRLQACFARVFGSTCCLRHRLMLGAQGFVEGHLKIISSKEVELADRNAI